MVKVTMLAGPFAGQVIEVDGTKVSPQNILCDVANYRHPWTVDYSDATDEERYLWEVQELFMKIVRALSTGATVELRGKKYRSGGVVGAFEVASQIEESIEAGEILMIVFENKKRIVLKAI